MSGNFCFCMDFDIYLTKIRRMMRHIALLFLSGMIFCQTQPLDPIYFYNLGVESYKKGEYGEAEDYFTRAYEFDADLKDVLLNRANARRKQNNLEGALEDLNLAAKDNPNNWELYYNRAYIKTLMNDLEGAKDDYLKADSLRPDHKGTLFGLASTCIELGDYQRAIDALNTIIAKHPDEKDALYNRAVVHVRTGKYVLAGNDLDRILDLDPDYDRAEKLRNQLDSTVMEIDSADIYLERGNELYLAREYGKALPFLDRARQLMPDSPKPLILIGSSLSILGEYDKAIPFFTQAITLDPNNPYPYFGRGVCHLRRESLSPAYDDFTSVLSIDPEDAEALINRSIILHERDELEAALKDLSKAITLKGDDPTALYNRGNIHYELKRFEDAVADYTMVIEIQPERMRPRYNRASALLKVGLKTGDIDKYSLANEDALFVVDQTEGRIGNYSLAVSQLMLGDTTAAITNIENAIKKGEIKAASLPGDPFWKEMKNDSRLEHLVP